jgi:hypothetical protein
MKIAAPFMLLALASTLALGCSVESAPEPEIDQPVVPERELDTIGIPNPECTASDCNGAPIPEVPPCPGNEPRFLTCAGTKPYCALYPIPCAGGETE